VPLQSIAIDVLLALSLWATLRTERLTLAGPGFMACGACAASLIAPHVHESFWVCAIASASVGFLLGVVFDRSVRTLAPSSFAIATLSFTLGAPLLAFAPHFTHVPAHPASNAFSAIVCVAAATAALA